MVLLAHRLLARELSRFMRREVRLGVRNVLRWCLVLRLTDLTLLSVMTWSVLAGCRLLKSLLTIGLNICCVSVIRWSGLVRRCVLSLRMMIRVEGKVLVTLLMLLVRLRRTRAIMMAVRLLGLTFRLVRCLIIRGVESVALALIRYGWLVVTRQFVATLVNLFTWALTLTILLLRLAMLLIGFFVFGSLLGLLSYCAVGVILVNCRVALLFKEALRL